MGSRVLVSDTSSATLSAYTPIDLVETRRKRVSGRPGFVYVRSSLIYIAVDNTIQCLNAEDLSTIREYSAGEDIERIILSHDGTRLYVLLGGSDTILMMDAISGEWITSTPMGSHPRDLRLDSSGCYLLAAGGDSASVAVLDATTLVKQAQYATDGPVVAAAFLSNGLIILSETGDFEPFAQLSFANTKTGQLERLALIQGVPTCMAFAMNGLLVGHLNGISMVNLQHNELRWRINVQGLPDLVTPMGRLASYMDRLSGRVGVVDCFQPTLMTVLRSPEPAGLAVIN
ncbi:hypothetical protein FACS18948_1530 [Clostridia bacterium]|nr:hypothetical protein FACS18948_1530 [Clostridia bacterium]